MPLSLRKVSFAALAATALVASCAIPANALSGDDASVAALDAVAPDVVSAALDPAVTAEGLTFQAESAVVSVPEDPSAGVSITGSDGTERVVSLPVTDDASHADDAGGIRVYDSSDATKTLVAVQADQITFSTILEGKNSPTEFAYDYANYGGELRQAAEDGGVTVWQDGSPIGFFLNPWAYDADGRAVPTHYEVRGTELVQVVDHKSADFTYPIVADPTYTFPGSNQLYTRIVEDRNASTGAVVLHVYPAAAPFQNLPRSTVISYYDAIVSSGYERNNLHDQLACHAYNAGFKSPWNLETWRPDVGYAATVAAACNP